MAFVIESIFLSSIFLLSVFCIALYYYVTRKFNFWKDHGVTYVKPLPFFGSLKSVTLQKVSIGSYLKDIYDDYKGEPYVGIFSMTEPAVVLRDLDLVKNILVKDAETFMNHILDLDEELDPLAARRLLTLRGERWRHMRVNLSPTFTAGKMRKMFYLVDNCGKELVKYVDAEVAEGKYVQVKDTMARFTTDVIASCAFGIESNSFKNPNAEFIVQLRKLFEFSTLRSFAISVSFFVPSLLRLLRLSVVDPSVNQFLRDTVWTTVNYREKNGITRGDFLDSMIELRKRGNEANGHASRDSKSETPVFKVEGDDFVAPAFSFLMAGFETSSSTMSFTLYELALQPDLQQRLRTEILEVLGKHNNELSYDAMKEMKYLDMVVSEALRKYPILPFLDRMSLKDYELPHPSGKGTVPIPAGTGVYIPVLGMHYNPEYFEDPEKFDPERFSEENKSSIPNYSYLPFGDGPRFCMGKRFGLMQTKTGLIHIIGRYEVTPCKETPVPLVLNQKAFVISSVAGIPLKFKRIAT
ncbi:cytochrome P450 6j1-like [Periplaneta americana]|uniref:cytochrome P450 6j1-like n=1 Tax=Periplaneta americana TaxID=6978 RepID=UPI0037E71A8F